MPAPLLYWRSAVLSSRFRFDCFHWTVDSKKQINIYGTYRKLLNNNLGIWPSSLVFSKLSVLSM